MVTIEKKALGSGDLEGGVAFKEVGRDTPTRFYLAK